MSYEIPSTHYRTRKIISTYEPEITYEDFAEWSSIHGERMKLRTNKAAYLRWYKKYLEEEVEMFYSNLDFSQITYLLYVTGTAYTKDGLRKTLPVEVFDSEGLHYMYTDRSGMNVYGYTRTSIRKAFDYCIKGRPFWNVDFEKGGFNVTVYHQYGTDEFRIGKVREGERYEKQAIRSMRGGKEYTLGHGKTSPIRLHEIDF